MSDQAEQRCRHGFYRSQIPCESCDRNERSPPRKHSRDRKARPHRYRHSDAQVVEALGSSRTLSEAAAKLGLLPSSTAVFYKRSEVSQTVKQAIADFVRRRNGG